MGRIPSEICLRPPITRCANGSNQKNGIFVYLSYHDGGLCYADGNRVRAIARGWKIKAAKACSKTRSVDEDYNEIFKEKIIDCELVSLLAHSVAKTGRTK